MSSKQPLLSAEVLDDDDGSAGIVNGNTPNRDPNSILQWNEHKSARGIFLVLSQLLFFVLGAGFYTFPMWLNFILPEHISLSRSTLTLLGAAPFIGLLGISGILVLWFNSLKFNKTFEFLALTGVGVLCTVLTWVILAVLVMDTPEDSNYQNTTLTAFVLILTGNAVGVFFTVWLGKLFPLIKPEHQFVFSTLTNMSFAMGSIVSLSAKLALTVNEWITFMLVLQVTAVILAFAFVVIKSDEILINSDELPRTDVSTKTLILELLHWKRQFNTEKLSTLDCQVRSSQFYLIILCFALSCGLATTFMANLGPLLLGEEEGNDDDGDDGDFRSDLIVLIWSSVGQTIARIILPVVALRISVYLTASGASQMSIRNKTTLWFTFVIGLVFFVCLLALRINDNIPFIVASTIVSGAYGSMWVINNTFPLFFPKYNFSVLLSFFQFFGMFTMILLIIIISALEMTNNQVFVLLFIIAVATMLVTGATIVDRTMTEVEDYKEDSAKVQFGH
jgi:hypothetical protein